MKIESLLVFTRYYKGEKDCPENKTQHYTAWKIESAWVYKMLYSPESLTQEIVDIQTALPNFESDDGIPITLKAVLFNRYIQYSEYADIDGFVKWYHEEYK